LPVRSPRRRGLQTYFRPEPSRPTGRCSGRRPGSDRTGSSSSSTRCSALRSCCQWYRRRSPECRHSPVYRWRRPGWRPPSLLVQCPTTGSSSAWARQPRGRSGCPTAGRGSPHPPVPARRCIRVRLLLHPVRTCVSCECSFLAIKRFRSLSDQPTALCTAGVPNRVVRARSRRPTACAGPQDAGAIGVIREPLAA
jgi:hypothetical protein